MKHELKITKDNYREVVLKRGIITCWILLIICLVVKIFGGNFFNIVCNDENFINICNYCDRTFLRYIISFIYFMFESCMLLLILKPLGIERKKFIFYIILCIICFIFKALDENRLIPINGAILGFIFMLYLYIILCIFSKRYVSSLIIIIYDTILVSLSTFIKNVSFTSFIDESILVATIFYIDYYIALILTFLNARFIHKKQNKKEV